MDISVILPTYRPGEYLWECLDSIYNQNFSKASYELIIVLNGCCEPYNSDIIKWIACHSDMKVVYTQTDIGGVSNARNVALDLAEGEFITFMDDDDMISPNYLSGLYRLADKKTVSLCYPLCFQDGTTDYKPYRITTEYRGDDKIYSYVKAKRYFSGPVYKLIHRDIIGNRRYDTHFKNGEDSLFMFLISDQFRNVRFTDTKSIYYRRLRKGSALSNFVNKKKMLENQFNLITAYTIIYFKAAKRYSFHFYFSRVIAALHFVFIRLFK